MNAQHETPLIHDELIEDGWKHEQITRLTIPQSKYTNQGVDWTAILLFYDNKRYTLTVSFELIIENRSRMMSRVTISGRYNLHLDDINVMMEYCLEYTTVTKGYPLWHLWDVNRPFREVYGVVDGVCFYEQTEFWDAYLASEKRHAWLRKKVDA